MGEMHALISVASYHGPWYDATGMYQAHMYHRYVSDWHISDTMGMYQTIRSCMGMYDKKTCVRK